jgi:hypothetical protein
MLDVSPDHLGLHQKAYLAPMLSTAGFHSYQSFLHPLVQNSPDSSELFPLKEFGAYGCGIRLLHRPGL